MSQISRRDFLGRSAAAAGAVALASRPTVAAQGPRKLQRATDVVTLGKTKIQATLLGMGTGSNGVRRSSRQLRLGLPAFTRLIRHGLDRGLRYLDVADQYGTHIFAREALKGVDRDKLFIQTKTRARHPEVAKVDIERFRQELDMDRLDSVLMHAMGSATWPTDMRPVMDVLFEAKQKGLVGAVGMSCHSLDALTAAVDCDWLDVQLVRINPFGRAMDGKPEQVVPRIKAMHQQQKGVIGMKIFACDRSLKPEQRFESLEFVLGLGCVDCFTIGFESTDEIDQAMDMIEKVLS
jgi:predicted aldo/keto reductase-like oxidoreductase